MSEMQGIEAPVIPTETRRHYMKRLLSKALKQADIKRLQAYEQWLRKKNLRVLAVQTAGTYAAFYGVGLYSHRVAWILLGVGVLIAAERQ